MSSESEMWRRRAAEQRQNAALERLPLVKAQCIAAAEALDALAERHERVDAGRRKPALS